MAITVGANGYDFQPAAVAAMNTETKSSVRKDALVATLVLAALGVLWLVFGLYWQGLLLLAAAGAVAFLGARPPRGEATPEAGAEAEASGSSSRKRAGADKARRGKKRRRRK